MIYTKICAFLAIFCLSWPVFAQDSVDLGDFPNGGAVFITVDGKVEKVVRYPKMACEVCVSRKFVAEAGNAWKSQPKCLKTLKKCQKTLKNRPKQPEKSVFWPVLGGFGAGVLTGISLILGFLVF